MGYQDESKGYRGSTLAVGAMLPILIGVFFLRPVVTGWLNDASMTTEIGATSALTNDPLLGPLMTTLKQDFPNDYPAVIRDFSAAMATDKATAVKALFGRIDTIVQRDQSLLVRAPAARLRSMRESDIAIFQRLEQTNPTICAEMGETGGTTKPLSPQTAALLIDHRVRTLQAIAAGRDTPVERRHDPKTLAVARSQLAATIPGALRTSQAREILAGERTADQALPIHRCELQVAAGIALNSIPADSADLLMTAPPAR